MLSKQCVMQNLHGLKINAILLTAVSNLVLVAKTHGTLLKLRKHAWLQRIVRPQPRCAELMAPSLLTHLKVLMCLLNTSTSSMGASLLLILASLTFSHVKRPSLTLMDYLQMMRSLEVYPVCMLQALELLERTHAFGKLSHPPPLASSTLGIS